MGRYLDLVDRQLPSSICGENDVTTETTDTTKEVLIADPARVRSRLQALARSFDWPRTEFAPGQTIIGGELSWRRFLQRASIDQLMRAIVVLEALEAGRS